jgi:hypothetical protein
LRKGPRGRERQLPLKKARHLFLEITHAPLSVGPDLPVMTRFGTRLLSCRPLASKTCRGASAATPAPSSSVAHNPVFRRESRSMTESLWSAGETKKSSAFYHENLKTKSSAGIQVFVSLADFFVFAFRRRCISNNDLHSPLSYRSRYLLR